MSDIDLDHWTAYLMMLRDIETASGIPIHFDNIRDVLWLRSNGTYPHDPPVAGCMALGDPEMITRSNEREMLLLACAAGFPQRDRAGFSEATLALRIARVFRNDQGKRDFVSRMHYDLFRSGRRVLEMDGLRLDNDARHNAIRPDAFAATVRSLASALPEYHRLVTALVETFPDNRALSVIAPKRQAMAELVVA